MNYYQLLDLPNTNPTEKELKKAFRSASIKYHPDKNKDVDTTDKFLEVKQALDVLSVDFTKSAYDLFGQTKFDQENKLYEMLQMQELPQKEININFWRQIRQKR